MVNVSVGVSVNVAVAGAVVWVGVFVFTGAVVEVTVFVFTKIVEVGVLVGALTLMVTPRVAPNKVDPPLENRQYAEYVPGLVGASRFTDNSAQLPGVTILPS